MAIFIIVPKIQYLQNEEKIACARARFYSMLLHFRLLLTPLQHFPAFLDLGLIFGSVATRHAADDRFSRVDVTVLFELTEACVVVAPRTSEPFVEELSSKNCNFSRFSGFFLFTFG